MKKNSYSYDELINCGNGAVYFGWIGTLIGLIALTAGKWDNWGDIEKTGLALSVAMLTLLYGYIIKLITLVFRNYFLGGGVADIQKDKNSTVLGAIYKISKKDEKELDVYEDYPNLYKKYYFNYYGKKVMTYTMVKKSSFRFPTERYLNVVKQGYKDCKLDMKYLKIALQPVK